MTGTLMSKAALAGLLAVAGSAPSDAVGPASLVARLGSDRILLVSAPTGGDPAILAQRRIFKAMRAGAMERDLVLIEATGDDAASRSIRERFGLDDGAFRAALIGKDGGVKFRSDRPLGDHELFPLIDAMPMRRQEMTRQP